MGRAFHPANQLDGVRRFGDSRGVHSRGVGQLLGRHRVADQVVDLGINDRVDFVVEHARRQEIDGGQHQRNADGDLQADPLRFEWSRDLGDRVLRLRTTYLVLTAEGFATETELSPDGGQSWQLVSRQEYRRSGS